MSTFKRIDFTNNMGGFRVLFLLLVVFIAYSSQHSYGLGHCPEVTPMNNFEMQRMLGVWHVIKKTATTSSCITYNFTETDEVNKYKLEQASHLISPGHYYTYHYKGEITVPDADVPANMIVKFALNLLSASYIVFMTDYYNYAAIFTCQSLAFGNRKSVSILSRRRTLEEPFLLKVEDKMRTFKLNPDDLSIISQTDCDKQRGQDITVTNATAFFGKFGSKFENSFKYVTSGAKKLFSNSEDNTTDSNEPKTRLSAIAIEPDAEWIP